MAFPKTQGYPDYTTAGTNIFIPEIFSSKLLEKFYSATVFGEIANTVYEGEIKKFGDKVNIRTIPDITINDYKMGQKLVYERPESASVELNIDRGKSFSFEEDDVLALQSDLDLMEIWSNDAGEQLKIAIDRDILGTIYADVDANNTGTAAGAISGNLNMGAAGSPVAVSKVNAIDFIVDAGQIMDEQDIPETDRWMVIPAWMSALIKKSDLKDASLTGDEVTIIRNGRLGIIDRFTLFKSNLLSINTADASGNNPTRILFGHKSSLTFASQLLKMETLKAESTFADLVRGLQVYGFEVIKPDAMGLLYAYKG